MSHDDYALEPDPTEPGQLPQGENVVWQGRPDWLNMAWRVYHLREALAYFALIMLWRGFSVWWETGLVAKALASTSPMVLPLLIATALIIGLGMLSARTTQYTITSKRLVMRIGMAMPTNINLPFTAIGSAHMRDFGNGPVSRNAGDIGIALTDSKIAYALLWPHARPWHLRHPIPMLRCIPNAAGVATLLAQALAGKETTEAVASLARASATADQKSAGVLQGSMAAT